MVPTTAQSCICERRFLIMPLSVCQQELFRARYEGMGQRLDYFLLSDMLAPRLQRCEILGHGTDRQGFLFSDHSHPNYLFNARWVHNVVKEFSIFNLQIVGT